MKSTTTVWNNNVSKISSPAEIPSTETNRNLKPMKLQFYKTKMCPWVINVGFCRKSESCRYAHTADELRPLPDLSKTKMCPSLVQTGRCDDANNCSFAHSVEQLRATVSFSKTKWCPFLSQNSDAPCPSGDKCRFAHTVEELRETTSSSPVRPTEVIPATPPLSSCKQSRQQASKSTGNRRNAHSPCTEIFKTNGGEYSKESAYRIDSASAQEYHLEHSKGSILPDNWSLPDRPRRKSSSGAYRSINLDYGESCHRRSSIGALSGFEGSDGKVAAAVDGESLITNLIRRVPSCSELWLSPNNNINHHHRLFSSNQHHSPTVGIDISDMKFGDSITSSKFWDNDDSFMRVLDFLEKPMLHSDSSSSPREPTFSLLDALPPMPGFSRRRNTSVHDNETSPSNQFCSHWLPDGFLSPQVSKRQSVDAVLSHQ